ncbi:GDSL esterase/lipase [Rhynchospora pubera]|uniref:GDSL esterase/lipase n=1 Tax=Rhynchospora pubera TaxID=906938 RepID=A0AAV8C6A6_9POAL|nr:GDSL esterase/lipase [Rhynchospora pubera]
MATSLLLPILLFSLLITASTNKLRKFSAVFYFGDSTLDTGNNGYIPTIINANHFPYGKDFPGNKPTGRFSNGLLVPDLLGMKLGLTKFSSPFLDPSVSENDMRVGVNFASAGSGFDETTSHIWNTIPMSRQVEMFKSYLTRLEFVVGKEEASRIIANSLILISAGTNDFTRNYYHATNKRKKSIDEYQDFVLQKVEMTLKELYYLGGRSFSVANLPPFGCTPLQITLSLRDTKDRECVDYMNNDATVYNSKLRYLLDGLQEKLDRGKFVYIDAYGAFMDILENSSLHGFQDTNRGCCGTGLTEVGPLCNFLTPTCKNVSSYIFYDAVHPTQRVYQLLTDTAIITTMQQFSNDDYYATHIGNN